MTQFISKILIKEFFNLHSCYCTPMDSYCRWLNIFFNTTKHTALFLTQNPLQVDGFHIQIIYFLFFSFFFTPFHYHFQTFDFASKKHFCYYHKRCIDHNFRFQFLLHNTVDRNVHFSFPPKVNNNDFVLFSRSEKENNFFFLSAAFMIHRPTHTQLTVNTQISRTKSTNLHNELKAQQKYAQ